MNIEVTKLTTPDLMKEFAELTVDRELKEPNMKSWYKSAHSPIRTQIFKIIMKDIPSFASTHFVRHSAVWQLHCVKTNRDDRWWDELANRETPVNHWMILNAEHLIDMAKKRLCTQAHPKVIKIMNEIKEKVRLVDSDLADAMVVDCISKWTCKEFFPCNYVNTPKAQQERAKYLNWRPQIEVPKFNSYETWQ